MGVIDWLLEGADGLWAGGACFPAGHTGGDPGQPWTATMHTLPTLQIFGPDPASEAARRAIPLVAEHGRWEHAGQRYFKRASSRPRYSAPASRADWATLGPVGRKLK